MSPDFWSLTLQEFMQLSIVGHEQIIAQFHQAIRSDRIGGSYLFSGPSQIGKGTVARFFAKIVCCPEPDEEPCENCVSCHKVDADNHPDVLIVRPLGTWIKIDQIREFQKRIIYRPVESSRKIVIVQEAERMNLEAANCLLKTLEEPPSQAVLILLTANRDVLLPTITSRCQIVQFHPLPVHELSRYLSERHSLDKSQADSMALMAGGAVGKALNLLELPIGEGSEHGEGYALNIPEILVTKDLLSVFRIAECLNNNPDELDGLLTWYRDLLLLHQGASIELLTHASHADTLKHIVRDYSRLRLESAIKTIFETKEALSRNVNSMLALEVMTLNLLKN